MSLVSSLSRYYFLKKKSYKVPLTNFRCKRICIFMGHIIGRIFEVIWLRTLLMAYPKTSISIQIWSFESKYLRIGTLIKTFCRCIKIFLALGIKKSVSKKLTFAKLVFGKFDFLDLVNFDFLDLVKFVMVDKFLILLPTLLLLALLTIPNIS